jgi:hypothetical protein
MSKETASQSQQKNAFDPFALDWRKTAEEGTQRVAAWWLNMNEDMAKLERAVSEHTARSVDEGSRLMRDSVEYTARLSGEWRNLALEASRRAMAMVLPPDAKV